MLGWFKKKFGKKKEEPVEEHIEQDLPVQEHPALDMVEAPTQERHAADTTVDTVETKAPATIETLEKTVEEPIVEPPEAIAPSIPDEVLTPKTEDLSIVEESSASTVEAETTAETALQEDTKTDHQDTAHTIVPADLNEEKEEVAEPEHHIEPVEQTVEAHPPVVAAVPQKPKEKEKPSFFSRLSAKLTKSKEAFTYQIDTLFLGKKTIDAELLDDLEEILIGADLGYAITDDILEHARRKVKRNELDNPESLKKVLKERIASFIEEAQEDAELVLPEEGPFIIMVVGVNGVGKTTTIGKIAHKFVNSGQSVLLVAADTFRAAAVSQLQIWGDRNGVDVFAQAEGTDPSSVAFDGIGKGVAGNYDVIIIDTAGRLHTQNNLMEELKKIKRVIGKKHEGAPHEVMLVIDATTGQNGISQAKMFNEAVHITGITLTKLDGTAKGGIVTNISRELKTPIRFIGVGEGIEDLRDFDHNEYIDALFEAKTN